MRRASRRRRAGSPGGRRSRVVGSAGEGIRRAREHVSRAPARAPSSSAACSTRTRAGMRDFVGRLGGRSICSRHGLTPSAFRKRGRAAALGTYVSVAGVVKDHCRRGRPVSSGSARHSRGLRSSRPRCTPRRRPRCCSTRSPVRTARVRRWWRSFSARGSRRVAGPFGFDANGDITESPVTIMRVRRGGKSTTIRERRGRGCGAGCPSLFRSGCAGGLTLVRCGETIRFCSATRISFSRSSLSRPGSAGWRRQASSCCRGHLRSRRSAHERSTSETSRRPS